MRLVSFTNVLHWPSQTLHKIDPDVKNILQTHLATVAPLLTITLSERTLSHALPRATRDLLYKIGIARIEFVGDDTESSHTIILPQYHPGYDAHTGQLTTLRRPYFLCWIQVWVYIDTTLKVLTSEPDPTKGRHSLCQDIMASAETRLEAAGFKNALRNAKEEFAEQKKQSLEARAQVKRSFSKTESTDAISVVLIAEKSAYLNRLDRFPKTWGEPLSQQRRLWAHNQWIANKNEPLQDALRKFTQSEWTTYAASLPTGYYLAICFDASEDVTNLPQAIHGLFLEKATERNIDMALLTTDSRREILQSIAEDMVQDRERFKKIKTRKTEVYSINTLHKIDLGTWTGRSAFKCEGIDGSVRKISCSNNRSLFRRKSQSCRRMLEFHDDGISIKNEHGQVLYPEDSDKVGVSIPVNRLDDFAENIKWLWEQAMADRAQINPTMSS